MNILNFIKFDNYYCQINPLFQKTLGKKISNYSETAQKVKTSRNTISRIINNEKYWANFQTLLKLSELLQIKKEDLFSSIAVIKTHNSFPITFDTKNLMAPSFFRILGHILGDGGIHVIKKEGKYRAFYVNNEQALLDSFVNDVKKLFKNFKIYTRKRENHGDEVWLPTTIGYLFYKILEYDKNTEKRVPGFVYSTKDEKLISSLLQALFDDEGFIYVDKYIVNISLGNEKLLQDVKALLGKINIKTNKIRKISPKNKSVMYIFSITSKENILKFAKKVNFIHPKKKQKLKTLVNKYNKVI